MDLSSTGTVLMERDREILRIHIDPTSKSLFWAELVKPVKPDKWWEIHSSDLDGNNVKLVISLKDEPVALGFISNRLFWTNSLKETLGSCEKETGNNLRTHKLRNLNTNSPGFLILNPHSHMQAEKHPCTTAAGALCSHICVPTAAGYMRCLCPFGYKLQSDGWNCGTCLLDRDSISPILLFYMVNYWFSSQSVWTPGSVIRPNGDWPGVLGLPIQAPVQEIVRTALEMSFLALRNVLLLESYVMGSSIVSTVLMRARVMNIHLTIPFHQRMQWSSIQIHTFGFRLQRGLSRYQRVLTLMRQNSKGPNLFLPARAVLG